MIADDEHVKREKAAARELRKSRWWQNKIQSPECFYCGKSLEKKLVTMDHVLPISKGGRSTKGNVVICCKDCNSRKRDLTVMEWEDYLQQVKP